jgi:hypothetical protein
MGTKYDHPDVLDGGNLVIKNSATRLLLVKKYTSGDSYATVTAAGNVIATATVSSADFTLADAANGARKLTFGGKSIAATGAGLAAGNGEDHEFVFTDGASRILCVMDETSEQANQVNDTITIPQLMRTSNQST